MLSMLNFTDDGQARHQMVLCPSVRPGLVETVKHATRKRPQDARQWMWDGHDNL